MSVHAPSHHSSRPQAAWNRAILIGALRDAFSKLSPRQMWAAPVMMLVWVGAALTSVLALAQAATGEGDAGFSAVIAAWLWLTVLFANFAEAVAEGRGKAQAESLRKTRATTPARRINGYDAKRDASAERSALEPVASTDLRRGDIVVVEAGELIPGDGDIVWGIASVDESAITGESAPVIREAGGDRSAVTGGTRVLSDRIIVRIESEPGSTFVDRMIALVEGAARQKTPNEIALGILLAALSIVFVIVTLTLSPVAGFVGGAVELAVLVALLVCLIPTTIGALLSAIGIAGMDRLVRKNVLAMSGRAVEAAGDVTTLLLDKTGTITYGNRRATEAIALEGSTPAQTLHMAALASQGDPTPEGASIIDLAVARDVKTDATPGAVIVPFSASTRMSGVDLPNGQEVRKGAASAILAWCEPSPTVAQAVTHAADAVASEGATPLVVASRDGAGTVTVYGVVRLKDVVKDGLRERFADMRALGIRTVMVTGDNAITAAAIGREAGVDEVVAESTPEQKLALIREAQARGEIVAMTGDGTNDAPALAQANVGVAMSSGTSAAKEAGNMVDLDSDPTKLIDIVEVGKQLLITRGALTTFSIANDVAKYFAIVPAMFMVAIPQLASLNIMGLTSPQSAVISAVIFNAVVIIALIPLALRGVHYRPSSAQALLRRNLLVYGLGGLIVPFVGIKLIDAGLALLGLV
jgi:K+-transporting ATPase ATPase B chain